MTRREFITLLGGAAEIFCIWLRALSCCRPSRASRGRKPIRRGRCASTSGEPYEIRRGRRHTFTLPFARFS